MLLNVAGAVVHYDRFIKELPVLGIRNRNIKFTVFDGPNLCKWNGGRINQDITLTPEMVERYNKFGIAVSLTFTNPVIDLDDPVGNHLLEMLHTYGKLYNIQNKVVLVNEPLREYILNRYDLSLIRSITGHSPDITITNELIREYKEWEKTYDYIVPKMELIFQPEFYENVDTSKYEILLNDTCKYGCPYWLQHFEAIAEVNRSYPNPRDEVGKDHCYRVEECWVDGFNSDGPSQNECMDLTPDAIKKALSLGYRSFKFSGRENDVKVVVSQVKEFLR